MCEFCSDTYDFYYQIEVEMCQRTKSCKKSILASKRLDQRINYTFQKYFSIFILVCKYSKLHPGISQEYESQGGRFFFRTYVIFKKEISENLEFLLRRWPSQTLPAIRTLVSYPCTIHHPKVKNIRYILELKYGKSAMQRSSTIF